VTAERGDGAAGGLGRLRAAHADREQAVGVLKAALVQGRLTKDEFDLRVAQALAARTYADLEAPTADLPEGITDARPPAEQVGELDQGLDFRMAARIGTVGAVPSMASAAAMLAHASEVPAVVGVLVVTLMGVFVAALITTLLMLLSWIGRRAQRETGQGTPSGPAGPAVKRRAAPRQLPSARPDPRSMASTARGRIRVHPV
jgi:hypothetical protein